jgi:PAS domain S-box-containing protein
MGLDPESCRSILDDSPTSIIYVDRDLTILWANQHAAESVILTPEEMTGRKCHEFLGYPAKPCQDCPAARTIESGMPEQSTVTASDGRLWEMCATPVFNADGDLAGIVESASDVTEQKKTVERLSALNSLRQELLENECLADRLKRITDGIVSIFGADFARVWTIKPADLCDLGCFHAKVPSGVHACRSRDRCLHLAASSGRYTHLNGEMHGRVPLGTYRVGRIASGDEPDIVTNDISGDPRINNTTQADDLGLVAFAGFRLSARNGESLGVLALYSRNPISSEERELLEDLAGSAASVIETARSTERLGRSESLLRAAINAIPDFFSVYNRKSEIVESNWHGFEDLPEEKRKTGQKCYAIFRGRTEPCTPCLTSEVFRTGRPQRRESTDQSSGLTREISLYPIFDELREVTLVAEQIRDVSESKAAESALRESEERFRALTEWGSDIVLIFDRKNALTYASPSVALIGYSPEEMVGLSTRDLVHEEDIPSLLESLNFAIEMPGQTVKMNDIRVRDKGGTWFLLEGLLTCLYDQPGVNGIVFNGRDITRRRETEELLSQHVKTQSVLLREVNHRVKNNLAAIISMLHREEERSDAEGLDSYRPVLRDLIKRVHGLSTVHSLLSQREWRPLLLRELCEQVIRSALHGGERTRAVEFAVTPSNTRVNSNDAHHLTLIFNELATNSLKHAPPGLDPIRIDVKLKSTGSRLTIEYRDNGPGFPEEIIQGDFSRAGVGFELIRGIVGQSLEGELRLENEGGARAVITFENREQAVEAGRT